MTLLNAADVALYFLAKQGSARPDSTQTAERITNLKLQKLCYYAQGLALARLRAPLFYDSIMHRQTGPIVPVLWRTYTHYGHAPIPLPEQPLNLEIFSPRAKRLLDEVLEAYELLNAREAKTIKEADPPWGHTPSGAPITHQRMKAFFERMIEGAEASGQRQPKAKKKASSASRTTKQAAS